MSEYLSAKELHDVTDYALLPQPLHDSNAAVNRHHFERRSPHFLPVGFQGCNDGFEFDHCPALKASKLACIAGCGDLSGKKGMRLHWINLQCKIGEPVRWRHISRALTNPTIKESLWLSLILPQSAPSNC